MKELYELYKVLQNIKEQTGEKSPIPIFSFEGLPGAGKTTQIRKVSEIVNQRYGKTYYVDLPTNSPIGKIMQSLYSDPEKWKEIKVSAPWLNPVMMSVDLRLAIDSAVNEGAQYAFMSRGILSTYYYNLDGYGGDSDDVWERMQQDMNGFYRPAAIIFMDLPEEEAHRRVVKRNRGSLRKMDEVEEMRKDRIRFLRYLNKLAGIPVYYINADGSEEEVAERIIETLEVYLSK